MHDDNALSMLNPGSNYRTHVTNCPVNGPILTQAHMQPHSGGAAPQHARQGPFQHLMLLGLLCDPSQHMT